MIVSTVATRLATACISVATKVEPVFRCQEIAAAEQSLQKELDVQAGVPDLRKRNPYPGHE